jgi:uncharacterized membrane protein YccC
MILNVREITDSMDFTNSVKVTLAAAIPVIVFSILDQFDIGFAIALGAFLIFPSDISSNLKHKINGLLAAIAIVCGSALLISLVFPYKWIFYPVFAGLLFLLSMISVYGHRATLVSFSGLLSASIIFGNVYHGVELLQYIGLMAIGGLYYMVVSLLFYYIAPNRYAELQLAEAMKLTAKYLRLRGDLWTVDANRRKITEKQLKVQIDLNAIHENLRETLILARMQSGSSNQNRKMLIVFVTLVEVLELGLSTSFDHAKMHTAFKDHPDVLETYQKLAYNLAATLKRLALAAERGEKYKSAHNLYQNLQEFENKIKSYENVLDNVGTEELYMLTNMLHYAEKQVERINIVERAYTLAVFNHDIKGLDKDMEKFIKPEYYPLSVLTQNLSFSSTIFRHSLRLTTTMIAGYLVGIMLPFQNAYWILLTIVVIMRPGYGLTKERSYKRILGTLLGGLIAFGILMLPVPNIVVIIMVLICMVLGLTYSHINYTVGATFVTMYVVFIYGMITPDVKDVVQYRVLDTVVGASLAFIANYLLWPSWEFMHVPTYLQKAISANRDYLKQISELYNKKGPAPVSYRLARKEAFIETGNLMASFQRMIQEPKSKQKQVPELYELAVLNHSLQSSLASLGTYIQHHQTTKASAAFNYIVDTAIANLNDAALMLKGEDVPPPPGDDLSLRFTQLKNIRETELRNSPRIDEREFRLKMEEAQLVIEQLIWLTNITESIRKTVVLLQPKSEHFS